MPWERRVELGRMAAAPGVHVRPARRRRHKPVPEAKVCQDVEKLLRILAEDCTGDRSSVRPTTGSNGQATALDGEIPRRSWQAGDTIDGPHTRRDSQSSERSAETECSEHGDEPEISEHQDEKSQLEDSKGADGEDLRGKKKKGNLWKRMKTGLRRTFRRKRDEEREKDQEKEFAESEKRGSFIEALRRSFRRKSKKKDEQAGNSMGGTPLSQETHPPKASKAARASSQQENVLVAASVYGGGESEDVPGAEGQPGPDKFDERFSDIPFMDEVEEEETGEGRDRVDGRRKDTSFTRCGSLEEDGAGETSPSEVDDEPPDNSETDDEMLRRIARHVESSTFPYGFENRLGTALRRAGDDADSRGVPPPELNELEQELLDLMRAEGDDLPNRMGRWFVRTVRRYVADDHTWSQFQFFLRLSAFAYHSLSSHAMQVSTVTSAALSVVRERYSSWLSSQGGMENMPLDEDKQRQ